MHSQVQPTCTQRTPPSLHAQVVDALRSAGLTFGSFDILEDEEVRQGLKQLSNWPTYPQLYAGGELLGGCDIILELAAAGELGDAVKDAVKSTQ